MTIDPQWKKVAIDLARKSGELIRSGFQFNIATQIKENNTPVTEVDLAISKLVHETLRREFPRHGLIEEESGEYQIDKEFVWVCDPLDGTIPFAMGIPTSAFSLALTRNGESISGVVYDPHTDRLFYAEKGSGASMNGTPIRVSGTRSLEKNRFGVCIWTTADRYNLTEILPSLRKRKIQNISLEPVVLAGTTLAAGHIPALVFSYYKPWDVAAIKIIIEEAGGKVTDLFGNTQRYDRETKGLLATNGLVHAEALEIIKECLTVCP